MNYQKHYDLLISSRLKLQEERNNFKKLKNIFDRHHIVPKCLKGTNDKSNIILLTYREHYIAHWLLTKIYPNESKLSYTRWRMATSSNKYIGSKSKIYELNKKSMVKILKEDNTGYKNPMFGTLPWNTAAVKTNNLRYNWSQLDNIYDNWISNNKCGCKKISKINNYHGPNRHLEI